MPEGTQLRDVVKQLIRQTIQEMNVVNNTPQPLQGQVIAINSDGTVDVQTGSGVFPSCGTSQVRTLNERVTLVTTTEGKRIAL